MTNSQADVVSAIEAMNERFVRQFNAGDVDGVVRGFYAEDADLLAPGAPTVSGRQQVRDAIQGMVDVGMADLTMETVKIDVSADMAYRIGRYTAGKPTPDSGKFVEVHRRQADGSWRCVADIFNGDASGH
jgi:ketosteroid isomerase-like protein